jgi:hypothetical protein
LQTDVLPCTEQGIRNAIAAGGGPFTFDCEGPTTVLTEATIDIDNDVILDGEGNLTVDGNGGHRVFLIPQGVTAKLIGFAVTGGSTDGGGGGIINHGMFTLSNSTVSGNSAGAGGGIVNSGTLTLTDSTVSGNTAANYGGGIFNGGTLTLTHSTVSDNIANYDGGGIYASSSYRFRGTLTMTNSTVSGNAPDAIYQFAGAVTLTNSTVSGNIERGMSSARRPVLTSSLIVDGRCYGPIASAGYNIEYGDTCGFDQPTDQVNVTAEQLALGPLQDNGGPTMTHALLPGSVAIDQIPEGDCVDAAGAPLTTDQRGEPRPETGGTLCDVGAFEVQP